MKELIPRPDPLCDRHGDELESYDEEENAAETRDRPRTAKKCVETGPCGGGRRRHLAVGRKLSKMGGLRT